jgi:hypothetical protein
MICERWRRECAGFAQHPQATTPHRHQSHAMRSTGVESDGRIALAMHGRHADQLAPQKIDAAVHDDAQHGIFPEVTIAGGNQERLFGVMSASLASLGSHLRPSPSLHGRRWPSERCRRRLPGPMTKVTLSLATGIWSAIGTRRADDKKPKTADVTSKENVSGPLSAAVARRKGQPICFRINRLHRTSGRFRLSSEDPLILVVADPMVLQRELQPC